MEITISGNLAALCSLGHIQQNNTELTDVTHGWYFSRLPATTRRLVVN
ncbi:MAG: hypothetical protein WC504_05375 [Methylobacter sp.]